MRRALLIPVLLTAAVGPYVANEKEHFQTNFSSLVAQIDSWNSSSSSDSSSSNSSGYNSYSGDSGSSSSTGGYGSSSDSSDSNSSSNKNKGKSKKNNSSSSDYSSSNNTASSSGGYGSGYSDSSSTGSSYSSSSTPAYGSSSSASGSFGSNNAAASSSGSLSGVAANVFPLSNAPSQGITGNEPTYSFHEVLRFDVTPRWVVAHWPRVTTVLAEQELEGLRVALVTGTKPEDIAGSLTYYFDKQHILQRLTFQGFTGDDRQLVQFLTQHYRFKSMPTLGAGLYLIQWNGKPRSALRINHLPVVRATAQNMRLEVMLEINRPRNYYGMSPELEIILKNDRENGRW